MCNIVKNHNYERKTNTHHNLKAGTAAEDSSGEKEWHSEVTASEVGWMRQPGGGPHPLLASRPLGKTMVGSCWCLGSCKSQWTAVCSGTTSCHEVVSVSSASQSDSLLLRWQDFWQTIWYKDILASRQQWEQTTHFFFQHWSYSIYTLFGNLGRIYWNFLF